jgi:hypothetical protein
MLNGTKDFALSSAELGGHEPYADDLRIELITDAGHFLHDKRPQLIADTALRFFAQLREESDSVRLGRLLSVGGDARTSRSLVALPDARPAESCRALVVKAGAVRRPLGVSDGLVGEDGDAVTDGLRVDEAHGFLVAGLAE